MMTITCSSCQRPLSIDESKIPPREVSFPCPVCKETVTVDGRKLAPQQMPTPPQFSQGPELSVRSALVGVDDPAVRDAAQALGFQVHYFTSGDAARDFILHEFPPVVFLRPSQITPPPLAEVQTLVMLNPAERRRIFIILVADNLRTFDGNAAFLYGVNLVVGSRDLPSLPSIYRDAKMYHQRLYHSMFALQEMA